MLILHAEPQATPSQPIAGHLGWYTSAAPCPYAESLRPMLVLQAEPQATSSQPIAGHLGRYTSAAPLPRQQAWRIAVADSCTCIEQ